MTEARSIRAEAERAARALFSVSALLDPLRLRIWDEAGLTVTQLRLLGFLHQEEGIGNAELAERLYITRPSVSALLDRLERGGYIRREISLDDRRSIRIWLEDKGRTAVVQQGRDILDYTARLFDEMTAEEFEAAAAALERMRAVGERWLAADRAAADGK